MKILITGISGFIGQHLSRKLIELGHDVRGLENKNRGVLNKELVEKAIGGADVVIHLAARTSHKDIIDNKFETLETNFIGTKNVLDAFIESKRAKKFIYASTGKVYGKIIKLPINENHPTNPVNILGKSKLITEKMIDFYNYGEKEFVIFRAFQVYGPGQKKNFLVPTIVSQVNSGKHEIVLGDIKAKRDYVFIDDLIDAIILTIERKTKKGLSIYNICTGTGYSARDIVRLIEKIKAQKIKIKVDKSLLRKDEVNEEYGSFEKAKKELNWEPKVSLIEGLQKLLRSTNAENLQAVIIAGGKGTRMQSISKNVPKILFPISGKPLLNHLIEHVKKNGIDNVIVCTGHLADAIEDHVKKNSYGIKIKISKEDRPLGTAGALHLIRNSLMEEFFVMFGDIYTTINLEKMLAFHRNKKADVTIAMHISSHPQDSTIVKIDENNKVLKFIEKPGEKWIKYGSLTATSLYIVKENVLQFIEKNKEIDFAKDVFPKMLKKKMKIYGYVTSEYAKDMGTPERYRQVEQYILSHKK